MKGMKDLKDLVEAEAHKKRRADYFFSDCTAANNNAPLIRDL